MLLRGLDTVVQRGKIKVVAFPPSMVKSTGQKNKSDEVEIEAATLSDEDKAFLRYRSIEAIEQEQVRLEQEKRLYSRYQKSDHTWPTWKHGEICPDEKNKFLNDDEDDELAPPLPARSALYYYGLLYRRKYAETYTSSPTNKMIDNESPSFSSNLGFEISNEPRKGWHRESKLKKASSGFSSSNTAKAFIFYYGPDGTQLRSRNEVYRYIDEKTSLKTSMESFKSFKSQKTIQLNNGEVSDVSIPLDENVPVQEENGEVNISEEEQVWLEIEKDMIEIDVENDFDFSRNIDTLNEIKSRDSSFVYYDNPMMNAEVSDAFYSLKRKEETSNDTEIVDPENVEETAPKKEKEDEKEASMKNKSFMSCKLLSSTESSEKKAQEDRDRFNYENDIYLSKLAELDDGAKQDDQDNQDIEEPIDKDKKKKKGALFDTNVELGSRRRGRVVYYESAPKLGDFVCTAIDTITNANNGHGATMVNELPFVYYPCYNLDVHFYFIFRSFIIRTYLPSIYLVEFGGRGESYRADRSWCDFSELSEGRTQLLF